MKPGVGLKDALYSTIKPDYNKIKPTVGDNRAFLVAEGNDEYLDLARRLYIENTEECQKLLLEIVKGNPGQRIYKDGVLGLCLKLPNKRLPRTVGSFDDQLKSLEEGGFIILRKCKKYGLVTTQELQIQNYKINEVFLQIVEISGRICKRLLCNNSLIFNSLDRLIAMISEIDLCFSHIVYSKQLSAVKPESGTCIVVEHAVNFLISNSCFQDYYFSPFLNFNFLTGENMSGKSTYAKGLAHLIVLAQLGCYVGAKRATLPVFSGMYYVETVSDINDVLGVLSNKRSDILIIVDNLECSLCIQLTLAEVLLESGAIVIYITHCHNLQQYLRKYTNLNVIECVNYKVKDGVCKESNAEDVCKEVLPVELYEKWMAYKRQLSQRSEENQLCNEM